MPLDALSTRDVAQRVGKDVRTIHRWVQTGKLTPLLKLADNTGAYVFALSEVERLEAELSQPGTAA